MEKIYERIYLKDLKIMLRCKHPKSIKNWCVENNVSVIMDRGSRNKYVLAEEVLAAMNKEPIKLITQKYGKSSEEIRAGINLYSELRSSLEESNQTSKKNMYKPQGEHELDFLSKLLLISKK